MPHLEQLEAAPAQSVARRTPTPEEWRLCLGSAPLGPCPSARRGLLGLPTAPKGRDLVVFPVCGLEATTPCPAPGPPTAHTETQAPCYAPSWALLAISFILRTHGWDLETETVGHSEEQRRRNWGRGNKGSPLAGLACLTPPPT